MTAADIHRKTAIYGTMTAWYTLSTYVLWPTPLAYATTAAALFALKQTASYWNRFPAKP